MAQARPDVVSSDNGKDQQSGQEKNPPSAAAANFWASKSKVEAHQQNENTPVKLKGPPGIVVNGPSGMGTKEIMAMMTTLQDVIDVFKVRAGKAGVCLVVTFASRQDAQVAIEELRRSASACRVRLESSVNVTDKAVKVYFPDDEHEEEGQPRTTTHSPDQSAPTTAARSVPTTLAVAPASVSQPQGIPQVQQFSSPKPSPESFELVSYLGGEDLLGVEPYSLPGGDEKDGIFVCTTAKQYLQARTAPGPFDLRPFWENTALNVRVKGLQIPATHKHQTLQRIAQLLVTMLKYQSNGIQPLAIQVVPTQPEAGVLVVGADEVLTVRLCLRGPDEVTLLTLALHDKRLFSSQYELRHDPVASSSSSAGVVWKRKSSASSLFGDMQMIQGCAEDLRQYAKFENLNDKCHFFAKHCGSGWPVQEVTHCSIVQVTPWGPTAVTQGSAFGWAMGVVDED